MATTFALLIPLGRRAELFSIPNERLGDYMEIVACDFMIPPIFGIENPACGRGAPEKLPDNFITIHHKTVRFTIDDNDVMVTMPVGIDHPSEAWVRDAVIGLGGLL